MGSRDIGKAGFGAAHAGLVARGLVLAFLLSGSACLNEPAFGSWAPLVTRQVGVDLVPGATTVEVRDIHEGWVERVAVDSDGWSVTGGIDGEPVQPPANTGLSQDEIRFYASAIGSALPDGAPALERSKALNAWVRRYAREIGRPEGPESPLPGGAAPDVADAGAASDEVPRARGATPPIESDDGREVLESIRNGARANCRSYATILCDAAGAVGITARRVDFAVRYGSPLEGHSVVEVWSPELGTWVVVDPLFQAIWTVDGKPASAIDLHRAVVEGRAASVNLETTGPGGASTATARVNPRLYPRTVFVRVPGGAWLTRTRGVPAPVTDANILQCDDDAAFSAPPGALDRLELSREARHGRIVFQGIGGRLVVSVASDRFEPGRFEIRATAGRTVEAFDDVEQLDPSDPEIAGGPELLSSTCLTDDDHDGLPDGCDVASTLAAFEPRPDGSALVAAGADGLQLTVRPKAGATRSAVGFARLAVEAGSASIAFARTSAGSLQVTSGRETTVSTVISSGSSAESGLRLKLSPNSRVVVRWLSVRSVPPFQPVGTEARP